jgi:hypothetical protein
MENRMAKRRGYTTFGYPIVWKRYARKNLAFEHGKDWLDLDSDEQEALIHEACMEKMEKQAETAAATGEVKEGVVRKRRVGKLEFEVTADQRCMHLTVGNNTSYYQTLGALASGLHRKLVLNKIQNGEMVNDLKELIRVEREATKEILEAFDTLPKFEVLVV